MSSFNLNYNPSIEDTRRSSFKSTGGLSFQKIWSLKNQNAKISLILLLAFCSGCLNFFFVERISIYNPGLLSVWQSIGRFVRSVSGENGKIVYVIFFWVFNSIINVVLAFATYKVIGKDMTKLSVLFIVGSSATGLALTNLPETWKLKEFFLFSSPFPKGQQESQGNGQEALNFLVWGDATKSSPSNGATQVKNGIILLFLYSLVFSVLNTLITSLLYALGGCGGGIDWIIFYLFKAKSYFANKLIFYTSLAFWAFSYIMGSYLPWALKQNGGTESNSLVSNFFSPLFFALLFSIFVRKFIFNVFYPRFRFINVKIFTNKFLEVRNKLIEIKFPHSFTIVPSFGSYSLRSQAQLEFICLLIELQELTQVVRKIDKDCFICSLPIRSLNARIVM